MTATPTQVAEALNRKCGLSITMIRGLPFAPRQTC